MEPTVLTRERADVPGAGASAVSVAGVSKWFPTADGKRLQVLQDIDLEVAEHSIVAILGASGCGKSTLLNIISGILSPDEGAIAKLGEDILEVIGKTPLYYSETAERFGSHPFVSVARALGKLHADEKLWQDPRGRLCVRGSAFTAKPPARPA